MMYLPVIVLLFDGHGIPLLGLCLCDFGKGDASSQACIAC